MKKLVATLIILGGFYIMNPTQTLAQETTNQMSKADLKKQSKIEKAQENFKKMKSKSGSS
jgi:uncharacterized Rossmann fold enzyme